jgi:hypothetical protein
MLTRKRTAAQQEELQEFASMLETVRRQNEQSVTTLHPDVWELYDICNQALTQHRDLEVDTIALIVRATERIRSSRDLLADAQLKLSSTKPSDWYPRRYRKAYDSWATYLRVALVSIKTAQDALESPEPLKLDPLKGIYTLSDLVDGLAKLASVSRSHLPAKL